MPVISVKIHGREGNLHLSPQREKTHQYPTICSHTVTEVQGPELINRWVQVIKKLSEKKA